MASGTIQFPKNNFGTQVDLKGYSTYANKYVCPCDGYVVIQAGNGTAYRGRLFGANATAETQPYIDLWAAHSATGSYYNANVVFVRRGMQVRSITGQDNNANTAFYFEPLE